MPCFQEKAKWSEKCSLRSEQSQQRRCRSLGRLHTSSKRSSGRRSRVEMNSERNELPEEEQELWSRSKVSLSQEADQEIISVAHQVLPSLRL